MTVPSPSKTLLRKASVQLLWPLSIKWEDNPQFERFQTEILRLPSVYRFKDGESNQLFNLRKYFFSHVHGALDISEKTDTTVKHESVVHYVKPIGQRLTLSSDQGGVELSANLVSSDLWLTRFGVCLISLDIEPSLPEPNEAELDLADWMTFVEKVRYTSKMYESHTLPSIRLEEETKVVENLPRYIWGFHTDSSTSSFPPLPHTCLHKNQWLSVSEVLSSDDRMFCHLYLGVERPEAPFQEEEIFHLVNIDGGDPSKLESATSPGFIHRFCNENLYERYSPELTWEDTLSGPNDKGHVTYGVTPFSFVAIAQIQSWDKDAMEAFGFRVIPQHMRHHYYMMVVLEMLQRQALLSLSKDYVEYSSKTLKVTSGLSFTMREKLPEEMVRYNSAFFYHELSPQIQAEELGTLIRSTFHIERLYKEVRAEVSEIHEHVMNRRALQIERWVILSAVAGILQMVSDFLPGKLVALRSGFQGIALLVVLVAVFFGVIFIWPGFIPGVFVGCSRWFRGNRSEKRKG